MLENNQKKELVLLEDLGMQFATEKSKQKIRLGLYKCYCGNEFKANTYSIKSGHTASCGCYQKKTRLETNIKHNLRSHRLYSTWYDMVRRCNNKKSKAYKDYGARGIKVCDRWLDVKNFIEDMYPTFKEGLSLDRIDNNKGYSKDNCRWATKATQARNTRKLRTTNQTGYRGVHFHKRDRKYIAKIRVNFKLIFLGYFDTSLEAAKAYDKYVIDNNLNHTKNF